MNYLKEVDNNNKISLRESSLRCSGGGAGELATTSLEFEFHLQFPCLPVD